MPSAGALYPFELYVVAREHDEHALFHLDATRRLCQRIDSGAKGWAATDLPTIGVDDAMVFVVSRPWLSMRKYADRGYLYTQLDAAHLAANLAGIAQDLGFTSTLRLGFARAPVAEALGFGSRCREIHSVLHLSAGEIDGPATDWSVRDGRGTERGGGDGPWWLEAACWTSLSPLLDSVDQGDTASGDADVRPRPLVSLRPGLEFGRPFPSGAGWTVLSAKRSSSKGFEQAGVGRPALWQAVAACQAPLVTDVAEGGDVDLTLVVRDVPGVPPGAYRVTGPGGDALGVVPTGDEVTRACMHQEHLRHAAAFAVLHTSREGLVTAGPRRVRDMLFRVGALGQLLYLGATEAGVGVTGVGGFDAERWRRIAQLSVDREPLYLVALGWDDAAGAKWDRLAVAYAQNER